MTSISHHSYSRAISARYLHQQCTKVAKLARRNTQSRTLVYIVRCFAALLLGVVAVATAQAQLTPRVSCVSVSYQTGTVRLTAAAGINAIQITVDGVVPLDAQLIIDPGGPNEESVPFIDVISGNNPYTLALSLIPVLDTNTASYRLTKTHSAGALVQYKLTNITASFGYNNQGTSTVTVTPGTQANFVFPGPLSYAQQPSTFSPGIHENVFTLTFPSQYQAGNLSWALQGTNATASNNPSQYCGGTITYQGRLTTADNPANTTYDLKFTLFGSLSGGNQIEQPIVKSSVPVSNGVFATELSFGPNAFIGDPRYLEISVSTAGANSFTTLSPRQAITSVPSALNAKVALYANRAGSAESAATATDATNATKLGGVGAAEYLTTTAANGIYIRNQTDSPQTANLNISGNAMIGGNLTVTGTLNGILPSDSTSYIQNSIQQQAASNFNVSGNGTVGGTFSTNTLNASGNGTVGGNLTVNGTLNANLPGGSSSYVQNTTSQQATSNFNVSGNGTVGGTFSTNTLNASGNGTVGGNLTVNGTLNANLPGGSTSYVQNMTSQQAASNFNVSGDGTVGGTFSTSTLNASGDGTLGGTLTAGEVNSNSHYNLLGNRVLTIGNDGSTYLGVSAGTTGGANTFVGGQAGSANVNGASNAFFGVLAGQVNTTGNSNVFLGTGAGRLNQSGNFNLAIGDQSGIANTTGSNNTFLGTRANASAGDLTNATAVGAGATVSTSDTMVLGSTGTAVKTGGTLTIGSVATSGGETPLCVNGSNLVSACNRYSVTVQVEAPGAFTQVHNLNTLDVQVTVYRANGDGTWNQVAISGTGMAIMLIDENTVKVTYFQTGTYRILIWR